MSLTKINRRLLALSGVISVSVLAPLGSACAAVASHHCLFTPSAGTNRVTVPLQQAIDQCHQQGGGVVTLPAGEWISGPLMLKSHVTLHLAAGSTLKSTGDPADFRPAFISQPLRPQEALIIASHVTDVGLTGPGTVDGQGQHHWWPVATEARNHLKQGDSQWFTRRWQGVPAANGMPRPWLIEFDHVQHGTISKLQVINSPMWNVVLRDSQDIQVSHSSVTNPPDSPNTDGVDIVSSQHISLDHLKLSTGDDDISIKSGLASAGNAPASRDITIEDIDVLRGHGVSVGSETANGIGRVTLKDIRFNGTENGLRIKSGRDRGEGIGPFTADNIRMTGVSVPLVITDSYGGNGGYSANSLGVLSPAAVGRYTPFIHDVTINHLTASGAKMAGIISGLPEATLRNIRLQNVWISAGHGLQSRYVSGSRNNVHITTPPHGLPWQQGPENHWTGQFTAG
ncbi:glycoside hydrolase family 28 protein [Tatumella punctata]|uniref:Glycoside hydrolase family 28 protein n=1 Tax=Tatumella punctata TaxID=399969 RepID=A0ABW1VKM4_9GAMM